MGEFVCNTYVSVLVCAKELEFLMTEKQTSEKRALQKALSSVPGFPSSYIHTHVSDVYITCVCVGVCWYDHYTYASREFIMLVACVRRY